MLLIVSCKKDAPVNRMTTYLTKDRINYVSLLGDGPDPSVVHPLDMRDYLIRNALYEPMAISGDRNGVTASIVYDSSSYTYTFYLKPNVQFSNGDLVTIPDILGCLKYLIDSTANNALLMRFKNNLKGYTRHETLKKYSYYLDTIPRGISYASENAFSISLIEEDSLFLELLSTSYFSIYKKADAQYYGTGAFVLQTQNDIPILKRKSNNWEEVTSQVFRDVDEISLFFESNEKVAREKLLSGTIDFAHFPDNKHLLRDLNINKSAQLLRHHVGNEIQLKVFFIARRKQESSVSDDIMRQLLNSEDSVIFYQKTKEDLYATCGNYRLAEADTAFAEKPEIRVSTLRKSDTLTLNSLIMNNSPYIISSTGYSKAIDYFIGQDVMLIDGINNMNLEITAKLDSLFLSFPVKAIDAYVLKEKNTTKTVGYNYIVNTGADKISFSGVKIKSTVELR